MYVRVSLSSATHKTWNYKSDIMIWSLNVLEVCKTLSRLGISMEIISKKWGVSVQFDGLGTSL
jgi:phage terminase large subunit